MPKKKDYGFLEPLEGVDEKGRKYHRLIHGRNESIHQHTSKIYQLADLLDESLDLSESKEGELFMYERINTAVLIFPYDDLRFELGPRERDSSKLHATLRSLRKSNKKISETISELKKLPPPVHLDFVAGWQRLEDVLRFTELKMQELHKLQERLDGRSNVRAVRVAKALRVVFERYKKTPILVTKDEDIQPSLFCETLRKVYSLIGLEADTFEPARSAKNCSEEDEEYQHFQWAIQQSRND